MKAVMDLYPTYLSTSNSTNDRGFLVLVAQALTSNVSSTTVGELNNDGGVDITSSLKSSIDGAVDYIYMSVYRNACGVSCICTRVYLVEVQLMAGMAKLCSRAVYICWWAYATSNSCQDKRTVSEKLAHVVASDDASRNNIEDTHVFVKERKRDETKWLTRTMSKFMHFSHNPTGWATLVYDSGPTFFRRAGALSVKVAPFGTPRLCIIIARFPDPIYKTHTSICNIPTLMLAMNDWITFWMYV